MSLPEGAVVAITAGLRFIGQRLDPRHALGMSEVRGISESELDVLGKRQEGVFQTTGDKEEDMRSHTEEIRKAIEGNREDRGDEG
jgi:hypothetical protein